MQAARLTSSIAPLRSTLYTAVRNGSGHHGPPKPGDSLPFKTAATGAGPLRGFFYVFGYAIAISVVTTKVVHLGHELKQQK